MVIDGMGRDKRWAARIGSREFRTLAATEGGARGATVFIDELFALAPGVQCAMFEGRIDHAPRAAGTLIA